MSNTNTAKEDLTTDQRLERLEQATAELAAVVMHAASSLNSLGPTPRAALNDLRETVAAEARREKELAELAADEMRIVAARAALANG